MSTVTGSSHQPRTEWSAEDEWMKIFHIIKLDKECWSVVFSQIEKQIKNG